MSNRESSAGSRRPLAFSFVELLIVMAVVLGLAAILMPALSSARRQAKERTNLSNFHQLGLAAELYTQASEARVALSPLDFKNLPEWSSPIWQSELDPSRPGFRNVLLSSLAKDKHGQYSDRIVPFRVSYVAFADLFSDHGIADFDQIRDRENVGWLVDFGVADGKTVSDPTAVLWNPYTRLNLDTSVVHRPSATSGRALAYLWLFCDPTREERIQDIK